MAQRRHHYERAFEAYLRHRRIPYVAVDEAKKALLPDNAPLRVSVPSGELEGSPTTTLSIKSFDFVLYTERGNWLIDVKGRKVVRKKPTPLRPGAPIPGITAPALRGRLECWVTREDVEALGRWRELFGAEFTPAFVFVYWCDEQPPDGLFQEVFDFQGRWYALRGVSLEQYTRVMKTRSPRWGTVDIPSAVFEHVSQPLGPGFFGAVE